jgi:hypothetical protein
VSVELPRISLTEFALRTVTSGGARHWLVLVGEERALPDLAARLRDEMESLGGGAVEIIPGAQDAVDLARLVGSVRADACIIVCGLEEFDEAEWRHLDLLRSRLLRQQAVALLLSESSLSKLSRAAPNLASWIGGSVWSIDSASDALDAEQRRSRLATLREWSGLSDSEVVQRARDGNLPGEPEYIEWLVLLGREDLIGR